MGEKWAWKIVWWHWGLTAFALTFSGLLFAGFSSLSLGLKFMFPPVLFLNQVHSCFGWHLLLSLWLFLVCACYSSWDLANSAALTVKLRVSSLGSAFIGIISPLILGFSPYQNFRMTVLSVILGNLLTSLSIPFEYSLTSLLPCVRLFHYSWNSLITCFGKQWLNIAWKTFS